MEQTSTAPQGAQAVSQFRPGFSIDTRNAATRNSRPADLRPFDIIDVRKYVDKMGNPKVAFNRGALHLSQRQLQAAGVFVPETLQGKSVLIEFFKPGDILLNGSEVTNDGIIVNQFVVPVDAEASTKLQYELMKESHLNWAAKANLAMGANNRTSGSGNLLNNGVQPVANTPAMQDPAQAQGTPSPVQLAEQIGAQDQGANADQGQAGG